MAKHRWATHHPYSDTLPRGTPIIWWTHRIQGEAHGILFDLRMSFATLPR
jgi:hypothetical protein